MQTYIAFKDEGMWYLLIFSFAVFSTSYFPALPHHFVLIVVLCMSLIALYCRYRLLFVAGIGVIVGCLHGAMLLGQQLSHTQEGHIIVLTAVIEDLPQQQANKHRFIASVRRVDDVVDHKHSDIAAYQSLIGQKLQLSWYAKRPVLAVPNLAPGQHWQFSVKLRRPRGLVNPSGFDYHAYLLRRNIYAAGYVHSHLAPVLLGESCALTKIDCIRWRLKERLALMSSSKDVLGVIVALAVGDSQWLTSSQWKVFKNTGTIHLLAISGLHIGLSAMIGVWLGRGVMRIATVFGLRSYYAIVIPAVFSVAAAWFYALLAGMSLPTQRALVMVVAYHVGAVLWRRVSSLGLLAIAACFIAITDPLAVFSQGFWLSFLAVCVLLYGFSGRNVQTGNAITTYCYSSIKAQWLLVFGLFLPSVCWLQGVSISAPIANVFAVTWVSVIVVPLLFVVLIGLLLPANTIVSWIYGALEGSVSWLLGVLHSVDQFMASFWYVNAGRPSVVAGVLCILGVLYFLSPRGMSRRYLVLFSFLPLFYPVLEKPRLQMTVMDVGQGTAIVIQTPNHQMVYDTGRVFSDRFDVGAHILTPFLRDQAIHTLDMLMVSHRDGDHAGGVVGLLESIRAQRILLGQSLRIPLQHEDVTACVAGQSWQWDGVMFTVLWPEKNTKTDFGRGNNNQSCVLLIEYRHQRILLTGDIEARVEQQLLSHPLLRETIDIMLVSHHGSGSSSSKTWIEQLRPRWAVVSAGYKNPYGHPHISVKQRYKAVGSQWLNTAYAGALQWELDEQGRWHVRAWRKNVAKYWLE